jgi:hypothetical protein
VDGDQENGADANGDGQLASSEQGTDTATSVTVLVDEINGAEATTELIECTGFYEAEEDHDYFEVDNDDNRRAKVAEERYKRMEDFGDDLKDRFRITSQCGRDIAFDVIPRFMKKVRDRQSIYNQAVEAEGLVWSLLSDYGVSESDLRSLDIHHAPHLDNFDDQKGCSRPWRHRLCSNRILIELGRPIWDIWGFNVAQLCELADCAEHPRHPDDKAQEQEVDESQEEVEEKKRNKVITRLERLLSSMKKDK